MRITMRIPFIFNRKNIALSLFCILCCILLTLAISGCGEDYSSSHDENDLSNTGSYACSIKWPEDVPTLESKSALPRAIDCDAAGVATVAFAFYDGSGNYLTGDEWSCSLHQGTVNGIPTGTGRRLVVTGKDASGAMLYWGEETGITIVVGQTTQGGEIEMEYVYGIVPSTPTNVTATAGNEQVTISWDTVTGATSYNIYWSTEQGVTKETGTKISTFSSPYTHTGLTNGTTYYYVVTAENSYGESDESTEVSVTPIAIGTNTSPTATITSPSDGSTYTEGDTITFTGTGEDAEDGTLTGDSLVWTSNIDGQIGTGESFTYNTLSLGIHTIALTVTDSDGATGSDSITVTVRKTPSTLGFEIEPNDDRNHADILVSDSPIIGQLSSDSDEDWFSISTSGAALITAHFYAEESFYSWDDWSISIEDASGNVLAQTDCCAGTDQEAEFYAAVTEAGTYYIIVTADYPYSGDNYTLTVSIS